jgi:hypothetical protein
LQRQEIIDFDANMATKAIATMEASMAPRKQGLKQRLYFSRVCLEGGPVVNGRCEFAVHCKARSGPGEDGVVAPFA